MKQSPVGVFNIDKPQGCTSHDVVAKVRKLTGIRRVGHAGTLDPLATGVLLVCIGHATRVTDYLQRGRKIYRSTFRFGENTDTYDAEGQVLTTAPVPALSLAELEQALDAFRGDIQQTPPMYSAIKHQGQALHKLARAGIQVERKARSVTIYDINIESWQTPDLTVQISCTPGTYVRSIAHDLGMALGCGGHVRTLRRIASGSWRVEDAVPLDELLTAEDAWSNYLHGLRAALSMLPPLALPAEQAYLFAVGQSIPANAAADASEFRVLGPDEQIIGIGRVNADRSLVSPYKVFADPAALAPDTLSGPRNLD